MRGRIVLTVVIEDTFHCDQNSWHREGTRALIDLQKDVLHDLEHYIVTGISSKVEWEDTCQRSQQ